MSDAYQSPDDEAAIWTPPPPKGRGALGNPANRFEELRYEALPPSDPEDAEPVHLPTRYYRDHSRSLLSHHDSPDIPFKVSLNPYRGCEHGCVYCYARPTHEYLGFSAGLDFESRIMVKENAPELLRAELMAASWQPQVLALSGVTDAYQPIERRLELTRRCLAVLRDFRQPVGIITKSALVTRDLDYLGELAACQAVTVALSLTTLDATLARRMEPRAATPTRRLAAIRALAAAGIPTGVMVAPVIPGLNDAEIPALLAAAAEAGASYAGYVVLRLPHGLADMFSEWLAVHYPGKQAAVLSRLRDLRGGQLYDATYGARMRGTGPFADLIRQLFERGCTRAGLRLGGAFALSASHFRRPLGDARQPTLADW